jgi:pyruvyl transferase EpsO
VAGSADAAETVSRLSDLAAERVGSLLPPGARCALVGFPDHANVGDAAIWLGERVLLERLGARVAYVSDERRFDPAALRARIGDGPVFLHGGGNLGDLWMHHQVFREKALQALADSPVVQLPQSIHFGERENLARARQVFASHPRLTLLLRDRASLELARNEFSEATCTLCPDMAFALGLLSRPCPPGDDVVIVGRRDHERLPGAGAASVPGLGPVVDWGSEGLLAAGLRRGLRLLLRPTAAFRLRAHVWDALARRQVAAGVRLLSRGRVVLTDRLHGHILALQLRIPHVVVDNSYGKVSGFLDAWTGVVSLVRRAKDPTTAGAEVRRLLDTVRDRAAR